MLRSESVGQDRVGRCQQRLRIARQVPPQHAMAEGSWSGSGTGAWAPVLAANEPGSPCSSGFRSNTRWFTVWIASSMSPVSYPRR